MKGLYVPPGRRKIGGDASVPSSGGVVEEVVVKTITDSAPVHSSACEAPIAAAPSSSSASSRSGVSKPGLYIPPGRRVMEEKRAAEAALEEERLAEERRLVEAQKLAEDQKKRESSRPPLAASAGALYVPRGRRELNEKRLAEPISNDEHPKKVAGTLFDRIEANSKPAATIPHVTSTNSINSVGSDSSNTYVPSDFDLACSTVIVRGFPPNYSFLARDSFATQYSDKGAMCRWLANDELLVVFRNEMSCLSELHSSSSYAFTVARLCDQEDNRDEYLRGLELLL